MLLRTVASLIDEQGEIAARVRSRWAALTGCEPDRSGRAVTVACIFVAAFGFTAWRALHCAERSALELAGVTILAAGALAALVFARRVRGHIALVDALHPLIWLVPWHLAPLSGRQILASAAASALAVAITCGWRASYVALRRLAQRIVARTDQRMVGLAALTLLVWLSHFYFPLRTGEPALDSSWQDVKGYELVHGWQAGVDSVFTFGPLGWFHPAPYNAELFWTKIVWWEIAFKLALTAILVTAARRMGGPIEKALYFAALLLLFPGQDSFFFTMVIAIAVAIVHGPRRFGSWTALGFLCLAIIALVKFTFFMLISISVTLIAVQRAWIVSWRSGVRTLLLYGVILVSVWTLLGQSPFHLPRFVLSSWWIAKGYNEGMTWIGPAREVRLAQWLLVLVGAIAFLHGLQRPRDKSAWIAAAILCVGVFMSLKAGFVRHGGNSITFFGCTALSIYLLPAFEPRAAHERILRGAQTLARIACTLLACYGCALAQGVVDDASSFYVARWAAELQAHAETLLSPTEYRMRLESHHRALERMYELPRIRAAVGREPIDVFGSNQSMALLNHLNYRPRPVFQSYSAYTPELVKLNAEFLESDRAPRFMLFQQEALDNRLPSSEDGSALRILMRDYSPRFSEGGMILLERAPDRSSERTSAAQHVVLEKTLQFDEELDLDPLYDADRKGDSDRQTAGGENAGAGAADRLNRGCYLIFMDIRTTPFGKLRATLIKGAPVFMNCTLSTGELGAYRLLPGAMQTGALVNPFLDKQDCWVKWYCGDPVSRISSFRVTTQAAFAKCFERNIAVRVVRDDRLVPHVDAATRSKLAYSMFSTAPDYVHSEPPPLRTVLQNTEVLLTQAPSEMSFSIGPGKHSLRARFGMVPESFNGECSDGAGFSIVARDGAGVETGLFGEMITRTSERRAEPHDIALEFETAADAHLVFRIDTGPQRDLACDWGYWTGVSIDGPNVTPGSNGSPGSNGVSNDTPGPKGDPPK